eukprot:1063478-Prorocentrum_minimum.AAC.2
MGGASSLSADRPWRVRRSSGILKPNIEPEPEPLHDITYKYAKRGSMAAAVSWKWVLLVLAERRMDANDTTANAASED